MYKIVNLNETYHHAKFYRFHFNNLPEKAPPFFVVVVAFDESGNTAIAKTKKP